MPSRIKLRPRSAPPPPVEDSETLFLDEADGIVKTIDSDGVIASLGGEGDDAGIPQGGPLTEDLDADTLRILNLPEPTDDAEAATKAYVDQVAANVPSLAAVLEATGAVPEVPASPTEQDIVDALVTLGLVTQAP